MEKIKHFLSHLKSALSKGSFYVIVVILAVLAGGSVYGALKYRELARELADLKTRATTNTDIAALVAEVGRLMILPTGEQPTIATVNEVEKLKAQPFFVNAQNGDKVLVYASAKRAILYRPSEKKIVEVAPVNLNSDAITSTGSPELVNANLNPTPLALNNTLVIRNGSGILGAIQKFEDSLNQKAPGMRILNRDTSANSNYQTSLIIDVSGDKPDKARLLAETLGLGIGNLPAGEATPSSDFLIILGTNRK